MTPSHGPRSAGQTAVNRLRPVPQGLPLIRPGELLTKHQPTDDEAALDAAFRTRVTQIDLSLRLASAVHSA